MDPRIDTTFNCGLEEAKLNLKYFGIINEASSEGLDK
jgi:hypothetical protein